MNNLKLKQELEGCVQSSKQEYFDKIRNEVHQWKLEKQEQKEILEI